MVFITFLTLVFSFLKVSTGAVLPRSLSLPPFITLEEHFATADIATQYVNQAQWIVQKLEDLDGVRLRDMDQGNIVKQ